MDPGVAPEYLPGLAAEAADLLRQLSQDPCAPILRNRSGHRLDTEQVEEARAFEAAVAAARPDFPSDRTPDWLSGFRARAVADVPAYRDYDPRAPWDQLPTICRADFSRDVVRFIPDSIAPESLITFVTSGTTGHPLWIPSQPRVAARYLAFHRLALRRHGIELASGRGSVGVVLVGFQRRCFTYLSVCPTQDQCLLAKLNLHPDDWHQPEHRARYLDRLAPEIISGDPISLAALAELDLQHRPRALLSTSMLLLPGLEQRLRARFGCPVLDLYSMNEAGPIAVYDAARGGHVLLQPWLYVEILDADGRPLPTGAVGEITLSGGFNPCLPLLRYRTGDYAALVIDSEPLLVNLSGRPPVRFRGDGGHWFNNLEITHALKSFALPQYSLAQAADGRLRLRVHGDDTPAEALEQALRPLFGSNTVIEIELGARFPDKVVQYESALDGAAP